MNREFVIRIDDVANDTGHFVKDDVDSQSVVLPDRSADLCYIAWTDVLHILSHERVRLLKAIHRSPLSSVRVLADRLGRRRDVVHKDMMMLEKVGLIDRSTGVIRATVDKIRLDLFL